MEKREIKCVKCGSEKGQHKKGFTGSGSQRMFCEICGSKYTPAPKSRACSDDTRKQTL